MTDTATEDALAIIKSDKSLIDSALAEIVSREVTAPAGEFTNFSAVAMKSFADLATNGGKRLRGSLLINSFVGFGGSDKQAAMDIAAAIEIVHAYLLAIDDFSDLSDTRRGSPTAHKAIEKYAADSNLATDPKHFGESIAVTAAIAGMHIASNIILDSQFSDTIKISALKELNNTVLTTAHGQFNDIFHESQAADNVSRENIINVMKWKTGFYTIYNPIQIGAIFAGAEPSAYEQLKDFSINAGIAFQIRDDIIGMFGDGDKTGKSNIDDITEGKVTLLMSNTLANCSANDKSTILSLLGKKDISDSEVVSFKAIVSKCGLESTKEDAKAYSTNALNQLGSASIDPTLKAYLEGVVSYIIGRDK